MNRNNIKLVTKIDSIDFYKKIYKKACNSFWEIRPMFIYSFISGLAMCSLIICQVSNDIFTKNVNIKDFQSMGILFFSGLVLCVPMILFIIKHRRRGDRSDKYINFLRDLKLERNLNNEDIDRLIEDVANLKIKYKAERDTIISIIMTVAKIVVFPVTAAIFTGLISNLYIAILGLVFICIPILSMIITMWTDFKSFENLKELGIKNNYLILSVVKELRYMKKL